MDGLSTMTKIPAAVLIRRTLSLAALALPLAATAAEAPPPLFTSHDPSYFLVGHRDKTTTARFQFSFKYMLFDRNSVPTRWFPPLSGMHFAYTQSAIWDLSSESKPFHDTNYRPALIWDWFGDEKIGEAQPVWSAQAGFEHESNGRRELESRSINTIYIEPHWQTAVGDEGHFIKLGARVMSYLERDDNPDIADFRGHAKFMLSAGKPDGAQYRLAWRQGNKAERYSVQLDASYPLRRQYFANTGGFLYVQIFTGYGETMLDYNMRGPTQYRIGFAVSR